MVSRPLTDVEFATPAVPHGIWAADAEAATARLPPRARTADAAMIERRMGRRDKSFPLSKLCAAIQHHSQTLPGHEAGLSIRSDGSPFCVGV